MTTLPAPVARVTEFARQAGFGMSCEPSTGALLAVLAAAVPVGGRILELGTGAGVGTAWIVHGLGDRTDVEVVTVDNDPAVSEIARGASWPRTVRFVVGDAVEVTGREVVGREVIGGEVTGGEGAFDLIFADAQGGKWDGLDGTIAALRPGGQLLVDDMTPPYFADDNHETKTEEVRVRLLAHPGLVSVPIAWASGLILSTRRHS